MNLNDFFDFQSFFKRCRREHNKGTMGLVFDITNGSWRVSSDLNGGIKNIKVFSNKISFIGTIYNDPAVTINFREIRSIKQDYFMGKPHIRVNAAKAAKIKYKIAPGPDL